MSRSLRHVLVWLHVLSSVGWMSQAAAMCVLMVLSATAPSRDAAVMAIDAAHTLDATVLVACANASAFTGFVLAAVTTWGYFRYRWVAAKFVITLGQLYLGIGVLSPRLNDAVSAVRGGGEPGIVPLAAGTALMASALAFQAWLSVAKPGGRTRRGEREAVPPSIASAPVFALCVAAPLFDVVVLAALGDPTPVAQLAALVVVLVDRRRRTLRSRRALGAAARPEPASNARVAEVREVCDGVRALRLIPDDLRSWEPGAHIDLTLPSGTVRQYSLAGDPGDSGYLIAVRLEAAGRGGSAEVHRLAVGDAVRVSAPRNDFPLVPAPSYLFLAGGIGVAPFLPMLVALDRAGADFRLVLRGRRAGAIPFADELAGRHGDRITVSAADREPRPDIAALVRTAAPGTAVYVCGPEPMISAAEAAGTVHAERFTVGADATGEPFDVYLARTRATVHVGAGECTLDALRRELPGAPSSCRTGLCGSCELAVLAGRADHRDTVPAPDRGREGVFYPCVSRSADPLLVVDA
ncbi:PDR/VanB family oxidoreductase [Tsukamurella sp. 1534]|uniref:PDR/VanB family oxidoreductase n=1 Tax=Tsukamurella sp. 1534 TaxID=1151061 RepID=UPI0002F2047D|nr:PDR/VanB family oxidoreductase [Tsukamurella sp. 1534]